MFIKCAIFRIMVISLLVNMCVGGYRSTKEKKSESSAHSINIKKNVVFDTNSFVIFWKNWKYHLIQNDSTYIKSTIEFPIHAESIILFNFSIHCDTLKFYNEEKKYGNLLITNDNFLENYDLIFTPKLLSIIKEIEAKEILDKSEFHKEHIIFKIFARNYIKTKCSSDNDLRLMFINKNEKWKIRLSGLF